jgi:hypothetical protein
MTVLSKRLQYSNNDFLIYQHFINSNEESFFLVNESIIEPEHPYVYVGYYSGIPLSQSTDPDDLTISYLESGYYSVVLLTRFGIPKNTLLSCNLRATYNDDLLQTINTNNVILNIKPFAHINNNYTINDYTNADKISNTINDNVSNKLFEIYSLNSFTGLNSDPTWSKNTYGAIHFNASGSSSGLKTISIDYVDLVYKASLPSAPLNPTPSGSDASAYLSWLAPLDNGGDNVIYYAIRYTNTTTSISNTVVTPSSGTNFTLLNLVNENEYTFRVAAINNVGTGNYSIESSIFIPEKIPELSALNYNSANYTRIRLRRDTSTNWSEYNPILALGEAGFETDTRFLKVGNNISSWNNLDYIKVPNSSISFPSPPQIVLPIGDSSTVSNPRISCNLSNNEILNIIGIDGIDIEYLTGSNSIRLSLNKTFSPFNSGTLASPTSVGRPGEVYYDNEFMYVCVGIDSWKRISLDTNYWFSPNIMAISNNSGFYPSITNITTSGTNIKYISDGDPYPAKSSNNMTNNGISPRSAFFNNYNISDQSYALSFKYRAGYNFSDPEIAVSGYNGILNNGVLISAPSARNESVGPFVAPSGFNFNRSFFGNFFVIDNCGGYVNSSGLYACYDGKFLKNCWNDTKVYDSNPYYSGSLYDNDNFRHSDGHSKILGFCFDGYPIYGPFGYSDATDSNSSVILLTSSYLVYDNDNHRPNNWKYTNSITVNNFNYILTGGAFIQDFYYAQNSGILDQHNGRYAVTPDFPQGTYAYFITFTNSGLLTPQYPYIIGNYSRNQKLKVLYYV